MIAWLEKHIATGLEGVLFALEHTGLYSLWLSLFLDDGKYDFTMLSGLAIKRSMGLVRGKSDKVDAYRIAEHAYEKKDKLRLYQMPSKTILTLKKLLSYRERLVKERTAFLGRDKEYKTFLTKEENNVLFESHQRMIEHLNQEIQIVEKELYQLIKDDEVLHKQYSLINTIKGVGPQTAMMMIVLTNGFKSFPTWRKFATYAGIAPFPNESGTSIKRTKVSHLANKRIKALLSCCASTSIQHNPEMRLYYQKRIEEGKNEMSTLNVVRNKLLSRIFAVVQRQTPYVDTLKYAA
jgi:transposase